MQGITFCECSEALLDAIAGNLPGHREVPPIAMIGRVSTTCNAAIGPMEVSDLLTTSDTPGFAMRITDYNRAQGAATGKEVSALGSCVGLEPIPRLWYRRLASGS